jgi:hypothetical protein
MDIPSRAQTICSCGVDFRAGTNKLLMSLTIVR